MDCFCSKKYVCLACERKATAKIVRDSQRKVAECGTRAGYNRHLKLKEPTCLDCKAAQSEAVKRWKKEKVS